MISDDVFICYEIILEEVKNSYEAWHFKRLH